MDVMVHVHMKCIVIPTGGTGINLSQAITLAPRQSVPPTHNPSTMSTSTNPGIDAVAALDHACYRRPQTPFENPSFVDSALAASRWNIIFNAQALATRLALLVDARATTDPQAVRDMAPILEALRRTACMHTCHTPSDMCNELLRWLPMLWTCPPYLSGLMYMFEDLLYLFAPALAYSKNVPILARPALMSVCQPGDKGSTTAFILAMLHDNDCLSGPTRDAIVDTVLTHGSLCHLRALLSQSETRVAVYECACSRDPRLVRVAAPESLRDFHLDEATIFPSGATNPVPFDASPFSKLNEHSTFDLELDVAPEEEEEEEKEETEEEEVPQQPLVLQRTPATKKRATATAAVAVDAPAAVPPTRAMRSALPRSTISKAFACARRAPVNTKRPEDDTRVASVNTTRPKGNWRVDCAYRSVAWQARYRRVPQKPTPSRRRRESRDLITFSPQVIPDHRSDEHMFKLVAPRATRRGARAIGDSQPLFLYPPLVRLLATRYMMRTSNGVARMTPYKYLVPEVARAVMVLRLLVVSGTRDAFLGYLTANDGEAWGVIRDTALFADLAGTMAQDFPELKTFATKPSHKRRRVASTEV